jgi:hypothetical protein
LIFKGSRKSLGFVNHTFEDWIMTVPKEEIEGNIRRAQDDFERLSDLREKLEILTEHVTGRKEALDEEIEESLHEARLPGADRRIA